MNRPAGSSVDTPDALLVARAARGDAGARQVLFERHREAAFRTAIRVTGRHADALDAVQDAFIRAFSRLERFEGDASFKTWLLRIVTNRSLDLLRARRVRVAVPIDRSDEQGGRAEIAADLRRGRTGPEMPVLEQRESLSRMESAVEMLPLEQRTVFALYAAGGMTYGEIAEILGVPVGTVMSRLFHARRKLRAELADLAPEGAGKGSQ